MSSGSGALRTETRGRGNKARASSRQPSCRQAKAQFSGGRRRIRRVLLVAATAPPVMVIALWVAVNRVSWAGPLVANTLRAIIGTDNVAHLEDFAYGLEDRYNRWRRKAERPRAYWSIPIQPKALERPSTAGVKAAGPRLPPFRPKDVGPMHKSWSAPGDGIWVVVRDPVRPDDASLYKTLLHPDKNRSWAEVFVVAVDLKRAVLHAVPGYREPSPTVPNAKNMDRPGRIPGAHDKQLLAAFNGGFMTEHGQYGMKVGEVTIVEPRPQACTIAERNDGSLLIATWKKIEDSSELRWFRQAPACMYEGGEMHIGLRVTDNRAWGATLDGDTVIRRSGIGLSADKATLYVAITNHTTARALAEAMHHAGAADVAQLDVNWSYPKFLLYEAAPGSTERKAVALAEGFEFDEGEYIRKRSLRDFFYLTRRD